MSGDGKQARGARRRTALVALALSIGALGFFVLRSGTSDLASSTGEADPARSSGLGRRGTPGATGSSGEDWLVDRASPNVRFSGVVTVGDRPAGGVAVTLTDELVSHGLLPSVRVMTDAAGRFSFESVPCIRGSYRAVAAGGVDASPAWASFPGCVSKEDIELRMEACEHNVYGVVSDASGGVVAGARIFLIQVPQREALSDERGRYKLCVGVRSSRLHVSADGYGAWFNWVSPRGAMRQDVTLTPEATLVGRVVLAPGQLPAPFAVVGLTRDRVLGETRQADDEGRFRFADVAPGIYTVDARTRQARSRLPVNVAVRAGSETTVTIPIDPRTRVEGRVVSRDGPVDQPVKDASINVGFWATDAAAPRRRRDRQGGGVTRSTITLRWISSALRIADRAFRLDGRRMT